MNYFDHLKKEEKYKIYKDLKSKNYFVTSGFKFGADFLAYKGNKIFYIR
jgi:tRNA-splicing endonuclease subunit Sen34